MNVACPGHTRQGSRDKAAVASTQEGASLPWRVSGSRRLGCAAFVACPEGVVDVRATTRVSVRDNRADAGDLRREAAGRRG